MQNKHQGIKKQNEKLAQQEEMDCINIQNIIAQTQQFSALNFNQEAAQLVLVKLFYLLNQSDNFNSVELEKILCGISKLFQFNDPCLKRMIYKVLKIRVNQQYTYIFIQSIIKDLLSTNQFIRLTSLKVIPYIIDQSILLQFVKYVSEAIHDKNKLVSDNAMIAALSLQILVPQKFSSEAYQRLNDYQEINLYALNLICNMKGNNLWSFIKTIQLLIKKSMSPQTNMQMIRIICKMIDFKSPWNTDVTFNMRQKELLNYVQSQVYYQTPMIFFESVKQLMAINKISNQQLKPYIKLLFDNLVHLEDNVEIFTALRIIDNLLKIKKRKQLIMDQQLSQIEHLTSSPRLSISSLAVMILIQTYQDDMIAQNFKLLYFSKLKLNLHINLLEGFTELVRKPCDKSEQICQILKQIILKDTEDDVIVQAVQIIDLIIRNQKLPLRETMECQFLMTHNRDYDLKVMAIQSIHGFFFKQQFKLSNCLGLMSYYYYLITKIHQSTLQIEQNKMREALVSDSKIPYKFQDVKKNIKD